jgi:integrase/recombinase XerD
MLKTLFPFAHARYSSLPILGGTLDDLCIWLDSRGYPPNAIHRRVKAARLLESLLRRRRIRSLRSCTSIDISLCFPKPDRWTAQMAGTLGRSLIQFLRERGELPEGTANRTELLVQAYSGHLENLCGLFPATIQNHSAIAREFLQFIDYENHPEQLLRLDRAKIDSFLTHMGQRLSRVTMHSVTATLRKFFRFAATKGYAPMGLDQSVELPRCYRGERLPLALPWESVLSLLHAIDRYTPKGRRDYAMFLLTATYGLRRSEVAGLRLDDIDWRARQIHVYRPKVGAPLTFPLTDEVATALIDYLRNGRPASTQRQVFFRVRIPKGPIGTDAVTDAFQVWANHAGVVLPKRGGLHCLRHSLAMHLLRQGTPLKIIGDLLGHRSAESTGIYLRLHVDDLRDVSLLLPKGNLSPEVKP